jgi:Kef-type K+ transport systems, predicted NAD-binding component
MRAAVALAVVVSLITIGTVGYSYIEKQSLLKSFYIMSMVFTAQGPPSAPSTEAGLIFTALMAYVSIGILVSLIAFILGPLLVQTFKEVVEKVETSIELKNHLIVCGYNEMSRIILHELKKKGIPVVLIDEQKEVVDSYILAGIPAVRGDASTISVLRKAKIETASALACCYLDDSKNAFAILTAKSLRPDLYCISRVTEEENIEKLKMVRADSIVSPAVVGAKMMIDELAKKGGL